MPEAKCPADGASDSKVLIFFDSGLAEYEKKLEMKFGDRFVRFKWKL